MVNMLILTLVLFSTLSGIYLLMYNSEIHMSEEIMDTLIENHKKNIPFNVPGDSDLFNKNNDGKPDRYYPEITVVPQNNSSDSIDILRLNYENSDQTVDENANDNFDQNVGNSESRDRDAEKKNPDNYVPYPGVDQWHPWMPWSPPDPQAYEYWKHFWENNDQWNPRPPIFITEPASPGNNQPDIHTEPPAINTQTPTEPVIPETENHPDEPVYNEETQQIPVTEPPKEEVAEPDVNTEPAEEETTEVLTEADLTEQVTLPPVTDHRKEPKPEFTVRYNGNLIRSHIFAEIGLSNNEILNVSYQYFFQYDDIENEGEYDAKVRAALNNILSSSTSTGKYEIDAVSYRYKLSKPIGANEYFIILLDRSIEISTLNRLLFTFIIIGCVGVIVVFIISLLLANWAIKPIEVAWNRQKQFIADASHELKTPLTVISTNTDVVLSNPNDYIKNQERWLKYIKSETARMSKLVSELLYIAKSDSNEIKMEMSDFDISNTISSICLIFEPLVFEAGRELISDISPRLKYYGDEDRVKQLITILLDNAVKYSIINSQISVSLFKNNQGRIKFCVSNKCEELSEENISKMFDRFYRVDTSRNSGTGGNGLGLNIAQTIAEAHNGAINVNYNYGMISFTVTL